MEIGNRWILMDFKSISKELKIIFLGLSLILFGYKSVMAEEAEKTIPVNGSNAIEEPDQKKQDIVSAKKEITFYSEKMTVLNKDAFVLEDKVLLIYKEFTLEADYLIVDNAKGSIKAKGNVRAINGDVQILCDELAVDTILESVKIKNANVNLNNLYSFEAKDLFILKDYFSVNGFKFDDKDSKHPIRYSVLVDKLNIFPFYDNKYFYLQTDDINANLFGWNRLSPLNFPSYSFFVRNPTLAKTYVYQRRIRGYFQPGSFFLNAGSDILRGPWASATVSYFSTNYSTGFLTALYGLFSGVGLSVYQDITDNKGNIIQFNGSLTQYDRYLKKANLTGDLSFLHDWQYDTLGLRLTMNQTYGTTVIQRLPEVSFSSIFRTEQFTGIKYRYSAEATRFILIEPNKANSDLGRIRLIFDLNSPKLFVRDNMSFQLLTDSVFSYFFDKTTQTSFAGQVQFEHDLTKSFSYFLRYRQRFTNGKSPLAFENLINNRLVGTQINYRLNDFLEFGAFTEFDTNNFKLANIDLITNYNTDYYQTSFLLNFSIYDIFGVSLTTNFKLRDF